MEFIVNEAKAVKRKYKCPYCEYRNEKEKLVSHIEKEHRDMLSPEFPASRVVFNMVNKKETGRCVMDGKETKWNDDTWRYDRFCSDKCKKEYIKMTEERLMKARGVTKKEMMEDPEHQKELLSRRKISGTYKFKDGGVRTYCGTYEKKLLEFYDKILNIPSSDIETPGPTIPYEYGGKTHFWITDLYYTQANLVHDVKDGGDNPNTRNMDEYRAKQDAKEAAIKKLNQFNYIRLTNNSFPQLLLILAEIKDLFMQDDDNKNFVFNINENAAVMNALPRADSGEAYIVPYFMNNAFAGYGYTTDKKLMDIMITVNGELKKVKPLDLQEFTLFKYNGDKDISSIISEAIDNTEYYDEVFFYEAIIGESILSKDQLFYDDRFEEVLDYYSEAALQINSVSDSILEEYKPRLSLYVKNVSESIQILENHNGLFAKNIINGRTTGYYNEDEMDYLMSAIQYIR